MSEQRSSATRSEAFTQPDWGTPDPEFDAWVATMPDKYWAKYDLAACRLGWHARALQSAERYAPLEEFDKLLAALKRAREALYNGFEPDNQSRAYHDIDDHIKAAGQARASFVASSTTESSMEELREKYKAASPEERQRLIHEHDCPRAWDFFRKHAIGSKMCPSCLACGHQAFDRADWWITHGELPDIYICKTCVEKLRGIGSATTRVPDDQVPMPKAWVEAAKCGHCGGQGWTAIQVEAGVFEQEQCQWCFEQWLALGQPDHRADSTSLDK